MMEETPRTALRDIDPSTLWVAYGFDPERVGGDERKRSGRHAAAVRRAPRATPTSFRSAITSTSASDTCCEHYRDAIDERPYDLQRRFVDHLRATRRDGRRVEPAPFHAVHHSRSVVHCGDRGRAACSLAGDAGGFVNGFTAEGIYYAMVSGELAARALLDRPGAGRI